MLVTNIELQDELEQRWQDTLPALASVKNGNSIAEAKIESWLASWGTPEEQPAPHQ